MVNLDGVGCPPMLRCDPIWKRDRRFRLGWHVCRRNPVADDGRHCGRRSRQPHLSVASYLKIGERFDWLAADSQKMRGG